MGAASALGTGCPAHVAALREGRDGLRPTRRFDTTCFPSSLAGTWPEWDERVQTETSTERSVAESADAFPALELATRAASEAWREAGLGPEDRSSRRIALVLGTCFGQAFTQFHELTEALAAALALRGPSLTVSTACSSSTNAIGLGRDLLREGRADVVLAGGVDVLLREVFAGFSVLGVLSPGKCAPWSEPRGTTLAEGAGIVVLEREADATRRGATALCTIDGYGLSADAHHETSPDPTGSGLERAIRWALADAGADASTIDHVNAHATGTDGNDRTEWAAITRALGRSERVPVSGLKSFLGHAMGAAGVLELILGVLSMREGRLPPTLHFEKPRPGAPPDPVHGPLPRPGRVQRALDISAAFGGANAVVVYGSPSHAGADRPAATAAVSVRGVGVVTPAGIGLSALDEALAAGAAVTGHVGALDLGAIVPTADPRRLDPSSRFLLAAAGLSLKDAGLSLRGREREETGLFLGASRMPSESSTTCQESLSRHGPRGISAAAFARMSVNAPAGACSKHLALKGPSTTVSIGPGSGLLAVVYAAAWLARRDDARALLAGAVDEAPATTASRECAFEGAVSVVLERVPAREPLSAGADESVWVSGWAIAGPGDASGAARAALGDHARPEGVFSDGASGHACLAPALEDASALPLGVRDVSRLAPAESCPSALALALAVRELRERRARSLLVVAARSRSAAVAVHLQRGER